MREMVIVKATKKSEEGPEADAGWVPTKKGIEKAVADMQKFNEELAKAGVLLAADGLKPSSKGKRVRFGTGKRTVVDGPFTESKELVAGFWLWQVKSMDEALEWVRRCPDPMPGEASEIEIRPLWEAEDFGPEVSAREAEIRAHVEQQAKRNS